MAEGKRFLRERFDREEVWLDLESGRFYGLNETGLAILEAWQEGLRDPGQIAERLTATFDVSLEAARQEVERFLAAAQERAFLEP